MLVIRSIRGGPSRLRPPSMVVLLAFAIAPAATAAEDRPKVVSVSPADGATDVPVDTEIRIRFDRPMSPNSAMFGCMGRGNVGGYRQAGPMRYDAATREFSFPVRLREGTHYNLWTQEFASSGPSGPRRGFHAIDGPVAEPFRWSITTASREAEPGRPKPRVVSVAIKSESPSDRIKTVEVAFDQPMDPGAFAQGLQVFEADYDPATHRFTMLLHFPANRKGQFLLKGLRSAAGVPADPIPMAYETGPLLVGPDQLRRAAESPRLREVIEHAREASRKIESVTVRMKLSHHANLSGPPDWNNSWAEAEATFRRAPGGKFVAEIDDIFGIPLRAGSDGTTCWGYRADYPEKTLRVPAAETRMDVLIADHFEARNGTTVDQLIRDRSLEYLGEADLNGRRCHLVQSWTSPFVFNIASPGREMLIGPRWYLDAETYMPVRVLAFPSVAIDFAYEGINEPIADEVFRAAAGMPPAGEPGPLPEGVAKPYVIHTFDGVDGRVPVIWGLDGDTSNWRGGHR